MNQTQPFQESPDPQLYASHGDEKGYDKDLDDYEDVYDDFASQLGTVPDGKPLVERNKDILDAIKKITLPGYTLHTGNPKNSRQKPTGGWDEKLDGVHVAITKHDETPDKHSHWFGADTEK